MYRDGSQNYSRNWKKKNHIPYFGAISSLLLFVASIRPIFCIFKTVFCTYICFSPLSMLICPPLYQITDHQNRFKEKSFLFKSILKGCEIIASSLWFSLALRNFELQHIPKIKLVWKSSLYISHVFMQFVLYYTMTQRYFQMFFGVQEINLIFLQQFLNFLNEM